MKHFTPALAPGDAAKNAREFVKENKDIFWTIVKPVLPYIVGLSLLDAVISGLFFADAERGFQLGALVSGYFVAAIMIGWHRVVLAGPDRFTPMNVFKPQRHELAFIFAPGLLAFGYGIAAVLVILLSAFIAKPLAVLLAIVIVVFGIIGALRISFYLPGKAINADMTFKKSWHMSKGYIWKMFTAGFYASWRLALVCFGFTFVAVIIAGVLGGLVFGKTGLGFYILMFIAMIPIDIFFQPMFAVLGVTIVSNYYQWAINNPRPGDNA
jgi:MFS family permease